MVAFAGNSLLCRAALRGGAIDAKSFTAIRLISGALVLVAITGARRGTEDGRDGSWRAAIVLAGYAIAFSYAYLWLGAGAGALVLFGTVQLTMITGGIRRGERPSLRQWAGLAVAATGMVVINLPSLDAPPPGGAALMIIAGVGWGLYSLYGRGAVRPIRATAGNFVRCLPFAVGFAAIALATAAHVTWRGAILAIASGGVTSGLGYCVWYAVLPSLGAARAAIVQLSVPVIAAVGAIVLLDEPLRRHVAIGGAVILGGLALALWSRRVLTPPPAAAPVAGE
ncbi:MAG: DMT family transporter [Deltaproteobacteria bacterium]|nr:MAG: DMT family transporter [Deltaproteobacteria bacterium]TMQ18146.1 MAG: DMT family transporter [Deltaproteobacteria bacterium]